MSNVECFVALFLTRFRIGGAKILSYKHFSDSLVQKAGRWEFDTFKQYIMPLLSDPVSRSVTLLD